MTDNQKLDDAIKAIENYISNNDILTYIVNAVETLILAAQECQGLEKSADKLAELLKLEMTDNDQLRAECQGLRDRVAKFEELALQEISDFGQVQTALEYNAKLRAEIASLKKRLPEVLAVDEFAQFMDDAMGYETWAETVGIVAKRYPNGIVIKEG